MSMPGGFELILVAFLVLLLFGGKKLPELAKGLGSGIKNFKKAVKDDEEDIVTANIKEEVEKKEEETKIEVKEETKTV